MPIKDLSSLGVSTCTGKSSIALGARVGGHVDVFTASLARDFCTLLAPDPSTIRTVQDGINGDCNARAALRLKNVVQVGPVSTAGIGERAKHQDSDMGIPHTVS